MFSTVTTGCALLTTFLCSGARGLLVFVVFGSDLFLLARDSARTAVLRALRVLVVPVRGFVAGLMVGGPEGVAGGEGICWAKFEVLEGGVSGDAYVAGGRESVGKFSKSWGSLPCGEAFHPREACCRNTVAVVAPSRFLSLRLTRTRVMTGLRECGFVSQPSCAV